LQCIGKSNRNDSRVTIWIINEELGTKGIVVDWIKPFGTIFINLLKMIAVPLIVVFDSWVS
jgi:L-cystine uptake protein TcyP (sodium:dicarboxylate symporter family)